MNRIAWLILLMLSVSACQSEAGNISALPFPEQPSPTDTELVQGPPSVSSEGLNPSQELPRPLESLTPSEKNSPTVEPAAKQTEEISPGASPSASPIASPSAINEGVLPTKEPTVTPTVAINGLYEGTFFRGLDSAPITMIDYSDFL